MFQVHSYQLFNLVPTYVTHKIKLQKHFHLKTNTHIDRSSKFHLILNSISTLRFDKYTHFSITPFSNLIQSNVYVSIRFGYPLKQLTQLKRSKQSMQVSQLFCSQFCCTLYKLWAMDISHISLQTTQVFHWNSRSVAGKTKIHWIYVHMWWQGSLSNS